ncbi:hypothetical protein GCM10023175_34410 [Pseudonocardia xishanensis]|uniref:Uncharacterized protein n=1 Tax=Pseudonocardia xishanensis TaxID=630995 RepID=A0ABP8RUD0_9PSEU
MCGLGASLSVEGRDDAFGQSDPGVAGLRLGAGHDGCAVADVEQGVAHEQDRVVEVDVAPVQCERFAFPETGADQDLEEVREGSSVASQCRRMWWRLSMSSTS